MSYNIYAKNKEKQLKELISQITARYDDKKLHDKKMYHMENQLGLMRQQALANEAERMKLSQELEQMTGRFQDEKTEKEFFRNSALENKRQKKLLKIALSRVQTEYDALVQKYGLVERELEVTASLTK